MPSAEERRLQLADLEARVRNCPLCPLSVTRTIAVPGEGPLDPKIFILGEAPGKQEDLTGRPFVGAAGKVLEQLLKQIGLSRSDVFITGSVKCRPPKNRNPKRNELEACNPYLKEQLKLLRPKIVVLLGAIAMNVTIGLKVVGEVHGRPIERDGLIYFPTYHPAAALRFPIVKEKITADFQILRDLAQRTP